MKQRRKRVLATLLITAMLASMVPVSAISVSAKDTDNTFTVIDEENAPKNLSSLSKSQIIIGDTVTINLSLTNSDEALYKVYYRLEGQDSWTSLSTALKTSRREPSMTFTPEECGSYEIRVDANYGVSDILPNGITLSETLSLEVCDELVVATESFMGDYPRFIDEDLCVYAWGYGGIMGYEDLYEYRFEYAKQGSENWTVVSDFSTQQSAEIKINESGDYVLRMTVKDLEGNTAFQDIPFTMYDNPKNTSTISAQRVIKGETVTITPSYQDDIEDNFSSVIYRYKNENDTVWTSSSYLDNLDPFTVTLDKTGNYEIEAEIFTYYGSMEPKKFTVYVSDYAECTISNSTGSNSFYTGEELTLSTEVTGGHYDDNTVYRYEYSWHYVGENEWHQIDNDELSDKCIFKATQTGDIEVMVKVTDNSGNVADGIIYLQNVEELKVSAAAETDTISVFDGSVKVTVTRNGGIQGNQYCYFTCTKDGSDELIYIDSEILSDDIGEITDYEVWFPSEEGIYTLTAVAGDGTGREVSVVVGTITVCGELYINPITDEFAPVGKTVTVYSGAEGGKAPYKLTYSVEYSNDETEEYEHIIIDEDTEKTSVQYKITKPGRYIFNVDGTDALGNYSGGETELNTYDALENLSVISADTIQSGDTVFLQGNSTGGKGDIVFTFFYKLSTSSKWTQAKSNGYSSYGFAPTKTGTYDICIKVTDSYNTVEKKYFTLKVTDRFEILSFEPDSSTQSKYFNDGCLPANTDLTFEVNVQGGQAPCQYTYRYSYYGDPTMVEDVVLAENSDSNKVTFSTSKTGSYVLYVTVTDSNGLSARGIYEFPVSAVIENTSSISSENISLGESVMLNGSSINASQGDESVAYTFFYKLSTSSKWTQAKSNGNSCYEFTPTKAGKYDICIKANDTNGIVAKKYFTLNVTDPLKINFEMSAESVELGETLTVNVSAKGGDGKYKYACYFKKSNTSKWTTVSNFGTKSAFEITPSTTGLYDICLKVKDGTGTIEKVYITVEAENNNALTVGAKLSSNSISSGSTAAVKAEASGGQGSYQYAFYYRLLSGTTAGKWVEQNKYGTNSEFAFKPTTSGNYELCVKAKDGANTVAKTYLNITVTEEFKNTSVLAVGYGSSSGDELTINKGDSFIVLTNSENAQGTVTYYCYYKSSSASKWIYQPIEATTSDVTITPDGTGDYDVCVYAKDESKTVVKKYMTVHVAE